MPNNDAIREAKSAKKDEFYTMMPDIEAELCRYAGFLRGKSVYCNCDDPAASNFVRYFRDNFARLGLRGLAATHYRRRSSPFGDGGPPPMMMEMTAPDEITMRPLRGDGDFRSGECVKILGESDVVVTNPPFSLFREYIAQLADHGKSFAVIGTINTASYKVIQRLIRGDAAWLGHSIHSGDREFEVPDDYPLTAAGYRVDESTGRKFVRVKGVRWFTNIEYDGRRGESMLDLHASYDPVLYPKYDNYDAINVDRVADIPEDYEGAMGVPITFLDRYNPDQFEILDANTIRRSNDVPYKEHGLIKDKEGTVEGGSKPKYVRIVIRARRGRKA